MNSWLKSEPCSLSFVSILYMNSSYSLWDLMIAIFMANSPNLYSTHLICDRGRGLRRRRLATCAGRWAVTGEGPEPNIYSEANIEQTQFIAFANNSYGMGPLSRPIFSCSELDCRQIWATEWKILELYVYYWNFVIWLCISTYKNCYHYVLHVNLFHSHSYYCIRSVVHTISNNFLY